jgi:quinol monooxygenase YgiN|tara:strand:- start:1222 stop:1506 length:285 start_codon:yes stop_codon:yes gene_type:complete
MYYRITTYSIDPSREEDAYALADSLREQMKAVAGLRTVHACQTDDEGGTMVVSCYDNEEAAAAAQSQIQTILGTMAQYMTSAPEVTAGPVDWEM